MSQYPEAILLGLIEGFTEFLPVSSTGHLLLIGHFLGFESNGKTFEVLVQLGAILAILLVYAHKLWDIAKALPTSKEAQNFVIGVLCAFLPAAVIGAFAHSYIKSVLFNPYIVCVSLIIGGIILHFVDKANFKPRYHDATRFPLLMSIKIGFIQCLAMVPGVSRSGATVVGAMLMGADKRSAAEFSFFLAMPTMAGAFAYDLLKNYKNLTFDDGLLIGIGFVCAFFAGLLVVKTFLNYISRHGFGVFVWWRLIVGSVGLLGLLILG